jgi:YfiH family protein
MTITTTSTLASRIAAAGLDWILPSWPVPAHIQAIATTRNGGVCIGRYATLNLGTAAGDNLAGVAENRRRLRAYLPSAPVWLRQVHGPDVVTLDAAAIGAARANAPVADAAVTHERNVVLGVLIADCLPVLLTGRNANVIAVAHAGWRGLARGVLENAVAAMGIEPADIVAWLGPAIGMNAFEVGDDVVDAFAGSDVREGFAPKGPGKWNADLYAIARARLERSGVRSVSGGGYCTLTDSARFFSYRRERETGRMAALIWIAS